MKEKLPCSAYLLVGIAAVGTLLLAIFRGRLDLVLSDPVQTPATWCATQPCVDIGGIILSQPSSTAIVYSLAVLTTYIGAFFLRTRSGQESRVWWGIAFVLTGIGAGLAGTSYQAFGYELKCRGYGVCVWTSWWEIAYMICTVAGAGAAVIGVACSILSGRERKFWTAFAVSLALVYVVVVMAGTLLPNRFLISFELMVVFFAAGSFTMFVRNAWRYHMQKDALILKVLWVWIVLVITIAVYYAALLSGFAPLLWERGIWFNENDVLHVMMAFWVLYAYKALGRQLKDAPGAEHPPGMASS